jgi:hypothetical protein
MRANFGNLYKPQQEVKKVSQPVDRLRAGQVI